MFLQIHIPDRGMYLKKGVTLIVKLWPLYFSQKLDNLNVTPVFIYLEEKALKGLFARMPHPL